MAKEEALSQLHVEKRLRANAEERCVEFSRKMAELESQLCALQAAGLVSRIFHDVTTVFTFHYLADFFMKFHRFHRLILSSDFYRPIRFRNRTWW